MCRSPMSGNIAIVLPDTLAMDGMIITGKLVISRIPSDPKQHYIYEGDLVFTTDDGRVFKPGSYITDEASVPRLFWSIPGFGPDDWIEAAILHDWMYDQNEKNPDWTITWKDADDLMYEGIRACGYSRVVAVIAWGVVRALGGLYW